MWISVFRFPSPSPHLRTPLPDLEILSIMENQFIFIFHLERCRSHMGTYIWSQKNLFMGLHIGASIPNFQLSKYLNFNRWLWVYQRQTKPAASCLDSLLHMENVEPILPDHSIRIPKTMLSIQEWEIAYYNVQYQWTVPHCKFGLSLRNDPWSWTSVGWRTCLQMLLL